MQTAAIKNRFITGRSSNVGLADSEIVVSRSGLLQHIVASHLAQTAYSRETLFKLTNDLIRFAEQAYVIRDVEALDEVSLALMNLPLPAAHQIGSYYHSLAIYRKGRKEEADALLERIADAAPITYRSKALQALGAHKHASGQLDEALRFQLQALRVAPDLNAQGLQTTLNARLEISIIKSLDGDHKGALSDLEHLSPLVNLIAKQQPFFFYAYCNELAVGLGELGRIAEAEATLDTALASSYASAYPNWAETRQELAAKRTSATPSVVPVRQTAEGIPASRTEPQLCQKPNRVLAFCRLIIKGTAFQITLILIAGFKAVADRRIRIDILDQLGRCFRARAPPPQH
ncbi:MAG TPA: hypothetical protein VN743_07715 [Blastocatellia bacterium]|nr:hypothetical protein [Blastocatellia bacterium]